MDRPALRDQAPTKRISEDDWTRRPDQSWTGPPLYPGKAATPDREESMAVGVDVDQIQHDYIDDRIPTAIGNAIRSLT